MCVVSVSSKFVISLFSIKIEPESVFSLPVIKLKSVVFPAPLGPIIAFIDCFSSSRLTLSVATIPPKLFFKLLILSIIIFTFFEFHNYPI